MPKGGMKKNAPKKPAADTKKPTRLSLSTADKLARIKEVTKGINKKLGGDGHISLGAEIQLEFEKIRTGNPALDYVTNGGIIRGGCSEFWGVQGSSKTTDLGHTIKHAQRQGLATALAAIEPFDRNWWRNIGVWVPYTSEEMDGLSSAQRKKAERYDKHHERQGLIPLTLIQHKAGDYVLQMVYETTRNNLFDLIGVDSFGAVKISRILDNKDMTDASEFGGDGNAALFSRFQGFISSAFNTKYDEKGNPDPKGTYRNTTAIVGINQARSSMNTMARSQEKKWQPTGGQALKHLWNQSIFHARVEEFFDTINYDGKRRNEVHSIQFRLKGTKMRGGPEAREARYVLHVKRHEDAGRVWSPGEMDTAGTLRALGVQMGVVDQAGAYYEYDGERIQGKDNFDQLLRDDEAMYESLYDAVMDHAQDDASTSEPPDVEEA